MCNRSRAVLYSAVVFLAGFVAGALLMNLREHLWLHPQGHIVTAASWKQTDQAHYIEQIKTELQLTEAQSREMEAILDATMRQYHDLHTFSHHIREEGITSIRDILNEEQRHRFDEIVGKMTCPLEGKGDHGHYTVASPCATRPQGFSRKLLLFRRSLATIPGSHTRESIC